MRIGSAVTFLFLALVALGFLLSNSINMYEELNEVRQENRQLAQQISALQVERDSLVDELIAIEHQVEGLTDILADLQYQIKRLEEENIHLKRQNSALQSQIEAIGIINKFWSSIPSSLSLALLLPIVPITAAASYVLVHYKRKHDRLQTYRKSQRKTLVQLTDDEVKEIIRLRRK